MSLDAWRDAKLIVEHETSRQEISELLAIVKTDLNDARIPALSADRRFACCYNALLTAARAALRATGHRVPKGTTSHHYYAIQSLRFTALLDSAAVQQIESMGKKRAIAEYVRVGEVSQSMAEDALNFAETRCRQIADWIAETHPDLLPG
ncbi:MAG: hypothetical protein WBC63_03060 [Candidatus Bipolaricaulia bacterium]